MQNMFPWPLNGLLIVNRTNRMQNMLKYYHLQHRLSLLHQRCSIFLLKIQRNTKIRKENLPTLNSLRIEIENIKKNQLQVYGM